jgi:hypothetical protein
MKQPAKLSFLLVLLKRTKRPEQAVSLKASMIADACGIGKQVIAIEEVAPFPV